MFSDIVLYADPTVGDKYIVFLSCEAIHTLFYRYLFHRAFPLDQCRFEDRPTQSVTNIDCAFLIANKKKTFMVFAESEKEKKGWLSDIQKTERRNDEI